MEKMQVTSRSSWSNARYLALFFDMQMHYDLFVAASFSGLPPQKWNEFVNARESASFQTAYWNQLEDKSDLIHPSGCSDSSVSTAVEANYKGVFRSEYLVYACGPRIARQVLTNASVLSIDFLFSLCVVKH